MKSNLSRHWGLPPAGSRFLIVILLVLGVFFRFVNLDRKVYWHDEVYTSLRISGYTEAELIQQVVTGQEIGVADLQKYQHINSEKGLVDTVKGLAAEEPQLTPLYFVLTRFWAQWFGDSVAVTRSLSALISLLVFPCLYWLCLELFESSLTGWFAIALVTVSPFYVLYAQEARHYSLWIVTILLSSAALLRAMRLKTKLSWGLYAASVALGLYTFIFSGLVAISHGIYVVVKERFRGTKTLAAFVLASLIGFFAIAPWVFVIVANLSEARTTTAWLTEGLPLREMLKAWILQAFSPVFVDAWNSSRFSPDFHLPYLRFTKLLSVPLLVLTGYSFYFLCRNTPKKVWLFILTLTGVTALALILPDLISGGKRSLNPRYLVPCYLGIQLAVAYFLATQITAFALSTNAWRQKFWQLTLLAIISLGVLSCSISSQAESWWNKVSNEKNSEIASIINQAKSPLLISDSSIGFVVSLSYLLDSKLQLILFPEIRKTKTSIPSISKEYSDVFLFDSPYHFRVGLIPENSLRYQLEKEQKYKIKPVYEEGGLWQIK